MKTPTKKRAAPLSAARPSEIRSPASLADEVEALARILGTYDLSEIEIDRSSERIRLRRERAVHAPPAAASEPALRPAPPAAAAVASTAAAGQPEPAPAPAGHPAVYITSPFVGTFYRQPSPDAPPFVEVGSRIRKGQVLCIIEAMKLMNEIEAEVDGAIVSVLAENGQPVEYGEPLFQIRP